jgi:predicted NAD-dependent protein-ADP-ribosyltransferase YbiA (DUF1768 family)
LFKETKQTEPSLIQIREMGFAAHKDKKMEWQTTKANAIKEALSAKFLISLESRQLLRTNENAKSLKICHL